MSLPIRLALMSGVDRTVPLLVRQELARLGYVLARSKRHLVYKHPSGAQVSVAKSASDGRSFGNLLSDARRMLRERGVDDGQSR